jgi:uncharacterized protein with HEPN domain
MRDHAAEAVGLVRDKTRAHLDSDRLLNLALVRLLEILGEAARRVPATDRKRCPKVPWLEIIGLRNRLIHAYDQVDFDILWQIVSRDLPSLLRELDAIAARGDQ